MSLILKQDVCDNMLRYPARPRALAHQQKVRICTRKVSAREFSIDISAVVMLFPLYMGLHVSLKLPRLKWKP